VNLLEAQKEAKLQAELNKAIEDFRQQEKDRMLNNHFKKMSRREKAIFVNEWLESM